MLNGGKPQNEKTQQWKLKLRMFLATALLFGIIYAILIAIGAFMGFEALYALLGLGIVFIQYLISPR